MKDILAKLAAIDAVASAQLEAKKKLTEGLDAHHPDELPFDDDELDSPGAHHPDELPYDDELDEAKPAYVPTRYPDTKDGIIAFMSDPKAVSKSWAKSLDLATCQIQPDSQVDGVWAVDSLATGSRVIVYLGGFRDPWGQVREDTDFEEGAMPMSKMRRLMSLKAVTAKQLKNWLKFGNIDKAQYSELVDYLGESLDEDYFDQGGGELYAVIDENIPGSEEYFAGTEEECYQWIKQNDGNDQFMGAEFAVVPAEDEITDDLDEAKAYKVYTIVMTRDRDGREMKSSGTLAELIAAHRYTLETGQSYQREKGNAKINCNPTNINALVKNLNNAVNNAAANGYAGKSYSVVDTTVTETSEDDWNEDPYDLDDPAPMVTDEAKNHMGDREYSTFNGWKAACRKAYPGCTFYGDKDIGGANLNGKDVGEWDGDVGCVYNKSMSGIPMIGETEEDEWDENPYDLDDPAPMIEAKAPTLASRIKNAVHADQISKNKDGNYVFRKGYFYRNGMDSDKWAQRVADGLAKAGLQATLVDSYDHWAAFKGGAGVKASSHFAAIFRIEDASSAPTALDQAVTEASPSDAVEKYPNNMHGVMAMLQANGQKNWVKRLDLPSCSFSPDPSVNGVWAVDSMVTGERVVVYLAGYTNPWGETRDRNDFEAGNLPERHVMYWVSNGEVSKKTLMKWVKLGTLSPELFKKVVSKYGYMLEEGDEMMTEREDDEPRLAFGQRDWEMDSEMNPHDAWLDYRAKGGKLSRREWEFDKEHGGVDDLTEAGPVRDPLALQVKKIATQVLGTPYSTARIAGGTVYRISIPLRGFAHPQQYHSSSTPILPEDKRKMAEYKATLLKAVSDAGLDVSKVDVRFHRGSGIYASVRVQLRKSNYLPQVTTESKKPKNLDDAIRKYGHEHPKTIKAAEREEKKEAKKKVKEGLEPTPSTNAELLGKLAKTINSCTSLDQLKSAERFSNSVFDKIADRMKKKHGFGSYKDVTTLMNQIKHDIQQKRRELSSVTESAVKARTTIILEGVKFRVSDPKLAKVLRRFPHESMKIDAGGELDDRLYDALYDHYLNNGEMPYGVAKARDGDPYEWVSDKISTDLSSRNDVFAEGEGFVNPEIEEIFDKYPHEAKLYRETGELDDGPLYEELFDHYCNNGEMPYGVAKARDGDPVQWIANQLERDLGQGLNEAGDDYKEFDSSFDDEEELDEALTPAQQERMERMKAQDAEWAKVKGSVESGQKGYRNPFASDSATTRGDELTWRSQQLAKSGKASGGLAFEDSVDPTPTDADDEVLVEQSRDEIVDTLSDLGFDEGLDFFFDGEDLVVIGRSTARAVVNAVGGHIISIDGEEVRISNKPKVKAIPSNAEIADLATEPEMFESKSVDGNALKENMTVSIQADGEEDVLSVIRKLSGMSDVASATPAPVGIPSALAVIDSIQADDYDTPASEFNIGEFGDTVEDDFAPEEEVEECYANTPEPEEQIGLSTTISNAGNEPGRRAYTAGNPVTESRIVRQYSKGQK